MNNKLDNLIDEAFKSKAQQRYFYWKAGKGNKKFKKMAKEFSDKTDFDEIPEKVKKNKEEKKSSEIDEVVDEDGNYISGGKDGDAATKQITSKSTTDKAALTGHGQMGAFGIAGGSGASGMNKTLKYWAEADMSKALGYDDTLGDDVSYEEAENHFRNELGLSDEETKERLKDMGYDDNLPKEKVRLIEKFIDEILVNKTKRYNDDLISKDEEINPIIKKQFDALMSTITKNGLSPSNVIKKMLNNE